jgi:SAM-dependent methyltransferase
VKAWPRVCDYEGSGYRREFWEAVDRRYEDAAERRALGRLLPPRGTRLLEIGAGFGRLVGEYQGYHEVLLVDYARSMLDDARGRLGDDPRLTYACADLYRLPFATAALDTVVQVRVLHHVEDLPAAFAEVSRVLAAGGSYVLEFANKRNLKAVGRFLLGRQAANPFDEAAHEFVPLNWNFHPRAVERQLAAAGLAVRERRALSLFRQARLKERLDPRRLAALDAAVGGPLGGLAPGPSQLLRAARVTGRARNPALWRCPACGLEPLTADGDALPCTGCGRVWRRVEGVWEMRVDGALGA